MPRFPPVRASQFRIGPVLHLVHDTAPIAHFVFVHAGALRRNWKGEIPPPSNERSSRDTAGDWELHRVALSFKRTGNRRLAPGQSVECINEQTAILRAELMMRDTSVVEAVAFSRRASADFRRVERAVILKSFGTVPKDFDIG
jgi:hypothetical protein